MKRNIHNRNTNNTYKEQKEQTFCMLPIPPDTEEEENNELELLIKEYTTLKKKINIIRGKMYRLGFDPENIN